MINIYKVLFNNFRLQLVHVRGKQVPILLTESMVESIDLLIQFRSDVGVSSNNPYVFAAPTRDSTNALRGYVALGNVTKKIKKSRTSSAH